MLDAVTPENLRAARRTFEAASAGLGEGTDAAFHAFAEAEEAFRVAGGYDFEARAAAVLGGLGLDAGANAAELSGGQTRRVLLARLLHLFTYLFRTAVPMSLAGWVMAAIHQGIRGALWFPVPLLLLLLLLTKELLLARLPGSL